MRSGASPHHTREESSSKRDSVSMAIHLGQPLPTGSSDATRRPGTGRTACVAAGSLPIRSCFSWGLPSHEVTPVLVSFYLTVSPIPAPLQEQAVFFSVALSAGHPAPPLAANPPYEVPTFLSGLPPSDHPLNSSLLGECYSTGSLRNRLQPGHFTTSPREICTTTCGPNFM